MNEDGRAVRRVRSILGRARCRDRMETQRHVKSERPLARLALHRFRGNVANALRDEIGNIVPRRRAADRLIA